MTMAMYITRRFIRNVFLVALVITGLSGLLISVETLRIAAANGAPISAAAILTLLQLPEVANETSPLIMTLAAMATFLGLARTSEMVIVRASLPTSRAEPKSSNTGLPSSRT